MNLSLILPGSPPPGTIPTTVGNYKNKSSKSKILVFNQNKMFIKNHLTSFVNTATGKHIHLCCLLILTCKKGGDNSTLCDAKFCTGCVRLVINWEILHVAFNCTYLQRSLRNFGIRNRNLKSESEPPIWHPWIYFLGRCEGSAPFSGISWILQFT